MPYYVDIKTLSKELGWKVHRLRSWTREGMPHRTDGRSIRYVVEECKIWIDENKDGTGVAAEQSPSAVSTLEKIWGEILKDQAERNPGDLLPRAA
jgi:hypothetical protein